LRTGAAVLLAPERRLQRSRERHIHLKSGQKCKKASLSTRLFGFFDR
jgi:hypothetical protein